MKFEKYVCWFMSCFIAIVVYRIMSGLHSANFGELCDVTQGVTTGKPYWLAYQNRLMGPYLVKFISYIANVSYCSALKMFDLFMTLLDYLVLYSVLLAFTEKSYKLSLTYLTCFSVMWLGIQHYWSYPWDYIDLGVFTLFAFFIFTRKPTIFFIALFLLEIINRESALFIPLFLVIDAFHIELSSKNIRLSVCHKSKLLIGMLLITLGILYTKFIRHFLFIESSIKAIADDSSHQLLGNHFLLKDNVRAFFHNFLTKDFVVSVFIVLMVLFLLGNVKKFSEVQLKALVLFMSLLISIFLFGLINETRMLTVLLPFLLFFHISFKRENQSNGRLKSGSVLF